MLTIEFELDEENYRTGIDRTMRDDVRPGLADAVNAVADLVRRRLERVTCKLVLERPAIQIIQVEPNGSKPVMIEALSCSVAEREGLQPFPKNGSNYRTKSVDPGLKCITAVCHSARILLGILGCVHGPVRVRFAAGGARSARLTPTLYRSLFPLAPRGLLAEIRLPLVLVPHSSRELAQAPARWPRHAIGRCNVGDRHGHRSPVRDRLRPTFCLD